MAGDDVFVRVADIEQRAQAAPAEGVGDGPALSDLRSRYPAAHFMGEHFGEDDAFALTLVGEHRRAGHVADGVDALR